MKTFVYVSVLVTIVAGVAFAFARGGNDVSKRIEKFVADQGASYDVGSTVAVVAAYREVYDAPPAPGDVRSAYDEMKNMGIAVDKTTATRYFREKKRIDDESSPPSKRFMDADTDASDAEGSEKGSSEVPREAMTTPSSAQATPSSAQATPSSAQATPSSAQTPASNPSQSHHEALPAPSGRIDPFLVSVSAELDVLRDRIEALSRSVSKRAQGGVRFVPAPGVSVRGRDLSIGIVGQPSSAPARFDGADNDSGDNTASLAKGSSGSPAKSRETFREGSLYPSNAPELSEDDDDYDQYKPREERGDTDDDEDDVKLGKTGGSPYVEGFYSPW